MAIHFRIWLNSIVPSEGAGSKHGLWVLLIVGIVGIGLSLVRVLFQWADDRRRRRVRKAAAHLTEERVTITYDARATDPAAIHELLLQRGYKEAAHAE